MTKKLTIINIIILTLIFFSNIITFYGINYPTKFNFFFNFNEYGFEYIIIILVIIAIPTALISTLNFKNLNFKNKFLGIFALVNTIFLFFIIFEGISAYKMMKNEYLKLEKEYFNKANLDIRNDRVTYRYAGGLTISECNQNTENKIDSINKKYGVTYFDSGCIIIE